MEFKKDKQPLTSGTALTPPGGLSGVRSWAGAHHAAGLFSCWTEVTSQNISIRPGHWPWHSETKRDHDIFLSKPRPNEATLCSHNVPNLSLCWYKWPLLLCNHSWTLALVCPPYRWGSLRCPVRDLPPPPDTNTRSRLSPSSIHPPRNHPPKPQLFHPKMPCGLWWTLFSLEQPPVRNLSYWPTYLLPGGFGWRTLKDVTRLSVRLFSCVFWVWTWPCVCIVAPV